MSDQGLPSLDPRDATLAEPAGATSERPWFAQYAASVPRQVQFPDVALTALVDEAVRRHGARPAIEYFGTVISFAQMKSMIDRFARALRELGVQRGDRVSLCLANVPQFPIAFYGALKAGAVVVPTNPIYTAPELEHQLNDAGVKVVVVLDQALPTLLAVRERTSVEHIILARVDDYFPPALSLAYRAQSALSSLGKPRVHMRALAADPRFHTFKDILGRAFDRQGFEVFQAPEAARADDLAVLQYTGGTTGVAKGAMLTHRNLVANATQVWAWSELTSKPHRTLCVAPFFHVYGLTVAMNMSVMHGATMLLYPRFAVDDVLKLIERGKPDIFPGVPAMYHMLGRAAQRRSRKLPSIRVCISGAAPLAKEVQDQFEAVSDARVVEGYGLTEASPVTHCNPVFGARRTGTIGLPLPNTDAAILDAESGRPLPVGEQGELAVKGPQVMQGYWRRPDATATMLRDGWLRTGDIATMSADGYFTIVDRIKDMIIVNGLKVFPREVEDVLYTHPAVLEAAVVGAPDAQRGERVQAYIVVKPEARLSADELLAYCRERLAAYKTPRDVFFRDTLPKTLIGKVLRRQLREEASASADAIPHRDTSTGD